MHMSTKPKANNGGQISTGDRHPSSNLTTLHRQGYRNRIRSTLQPPRHTQITRFQKTLIPGAQCTTLSSMSSRTSLTSQCLCFITWRVWDKSSKSRLRFHQTEFNTSKKNKTKNKNKKNPQPNMIHSRSTIAQFAFLPPPFRPAVFEAVVGFRTMLGDINKSLLMPPKFGPRGAKTKTKPRRRERKRERWGEATNK